ISRERKRTASDFFMFGALCRPPRISVAARPVERGFLSMNRTNSERALPLKAAEDRRTPRHWRVGHGRARFRKILRRPCGALDCPDRFIVPMHGTKVVGLPEASSVPRRRAWISRRRL